MVKLFQEMYVPTLVSLADTLSTQNKGLLEPLELITLHKASYLLSTCQSGYARSEMFVDITVLRIRILI